MARQPDENEVAPAEVSMAWRVPLLVRIIALGLGLNGLAWVAASWRPDDHGTWTLVSVLGFFLVGLLIGRWWALLVTCAYAVIHAVPVYFGLLPGYLSTWGEALWWIVALVFLLALTGAGVLCRRGIRRFRSESIS